MKKLIIIFLLLSNPASAQSLIFVNSDSLKNGDILMYSGKGFISGLIKFFDGSEYSHAGIYNNGKVLEANPEGVVDVDLMKSIQDAEFVDVYRFKIKDSIEQMEFEKNIDCVIANYKVNGDRYAYEQFLLLGVLTTTRAINFPVFAPVLRAFTDNSMTYLANLVKSGREPMICSELVYRCYDEADTAGKFRILIDGAKLNDSVLALTSDILRESRKDNEDSEVLRIIDSQFKDFIFLYERSKKQNGGYMTEADFITPNDLRKSRSLYKVGRLE